MSDRLPTPPRRRIRGPVLVATVLCLAASVNAANPPDPDQLVRQLERTLADTNTHKAALKSGAERVAFCTYCHGKDGNGLKPEVPKLAGQNAKYLFNQFENFAAGRRKNLVMQELAGNLSADDRIAVAIYFASLPVHPEVVDAALANNGKIIFDSVCAVCHGRTGLGQEQFPRLAGQNPTYVARTLRGFRTDESTHADPIMRQIAQTLTDDNVAAISAYVASLR